MTEGETDEITGWGGVIATALNVAQMAALLAVAAARGDEALARRQAVQLVCEVAAISRYIARRTGEAS